ncbi:MAG: rod shape-determining protein MreC [Bacillota bacterium]
MAKQSQDRRSLILLLVVVLGLLLLINITGEGRGQLTPIEDALLALFAPVQTVFSSAGQRLQHLYDAVVSFHELRAENERLQQEIAFIEGQLVQFQELQKQNYRYRRLLDFQESTAYRLQPAEVIARDPSQWFGAITINRGYLDGVEREMAVITDRGLVGMVSTVSPNSSQVILITDPRLAVSATVQRSRDPGIVGTVESHANDSSYLTMTNLPPDTQIQLGDVIISSGLGGIFPEGLFIGTVKEIGDDRLGLVLSVVIEPGVNFNRLEEVFIVLGQGEKRVEPDDAGEEAQ